MPRTWRVLPRSGLWFDARIMPLRLNREGLRVTGTHNFSASLKSHYRS